MKSFLIIKKKKIINLNCKFFLFFKYILFDCLEYLIFRHLGYLRIFGTFFYFIFFILPFRKFYCIKFNAILEKVNDVIFLKHFYVSLMKILLIFFFCFGFVYRQELIKYNWKFIKWDIKIICCGLFMDFFCLLFYLLAFFTIRI